MDIVEATKSYEAWLGARVTLVKSDVKAKHGIMRESAFGFLRATYYRWAQQFLVLCAGPAAAPKVLGVGDLHLENFGTWHDAQARLVWGINDFDEAAMLPYTIDLVRLAASALIAVGEGSLDIGAKRACGEILSGYAAGIAAKDARPFVLEEDNAALRAIAMGDRHEPKAFWKGILAGKNAEPPDDVKRLILHHLPKGMADMMFRRRVAGAGSLGLPRFAAVGMLDGSYVGREAKARAPSARVWAGVGAASPRAQGLIVARAMRPRDPFLHVEPHWIVRRLAPHSERIALADIARAGERRAVLHAMGVETANIHRGTTGAMARIARHLAAQKDGWLHDAAARMAEAVRKDWKAWKKRG
jgi:hypothetical protein